jgi:hypothetical protein
MATPQKGQGRVIVILAMATVFRIAFLFKPAFGLQEDAAVDMASQLIEAVERKHGKINFDA